MPNNVAAAIDSKPPPVPMAGFVEAEDLFDDRKILPLEDEVDTFGRGGSASTADGDLFNSGVAPLEQEAPSSERPGEGDHDVRASGGVRFVEIQASDVDLAEPSLTVPGDPADADLAYVDSVDAQQTSENTDVDAQLAETRLPWTGPHAHDRGVFWDGNGPIPELNGPRSIHAGLSTFWTQSVDRPAWMDLRITHRYV